MSLIKLEKVSKYYKSEDTVSVGMKNVDLEFELGEFVAITGESGSGKSTLLNVISGLDGYESGEMYLFGEETSHYMISDWEKYRGAYVGFVFQNYNIIDSYTVLQNVLLALEIQGYDPKKRKERALQLIEQVGLSSHKHHKAAKLSGGQKQRVVIARALAKDCPIIAADEPTGNLDSESGKQIMKLLHEVSKDKLVLLVTHDFEQAEPYATRKIKMHDGEVIEDKKLTSHEEVTLEEPIKPKKMKFTTLLRLAIRNFFATPKRLIFTLLLQIIVATVFILVYSNQVASIREAGLSQSSIFPSVPETRLLVEKRDGSEFTDNDLKALEKMKGVKKVHRYASNFLNTKNLAISTNQYRFSVNVRATDTALTLKPNEVEGRLPVAKDEVVISSYYDQIKIGSVISIELGGYYYEAYDYFLGEPLPVKKLNDLGTFKVVGIDKLNRRTIYFSEEYLNTPSINDTEIDYQKYIQNYEIMMSYLEFVDENNNIFRIVASDKGFGSEYDLYVPGYQYDTDGKYVESTINLTVRTKCYGQRDLVQHLQNVSYYGYDLSLYNDTYFEVFIDSDFYIQIRDEFFKQSKDVYEMKNRNLVSISVSGYANGRRILKNIDSDNFKVFYPSYIFDPMREILVFLYTLLAILLLSLIGILFTTIITVVTKNVMKGRIKDFAIYRSIGANKYMLARLVVLEQILLSVSAFMITIIIMVILRANVYQISRTIPYLQYYDFIILLIIFILLGTRLGLKFNRKIFKQSVIETLSESKEDL